MKKEMKSVEKGDFSVRVDTKINNEIGELGESFNHMNKKVEQLLDEVVSAERNKNEMELEVLHAQINPHFLYNTLNTIRMMAKIKGEESISSAIVALVKLLRISINLGKNMITLDEEISYIENYLLIQKLRFNQRFTIDYTIRDEDRAQLIPKLILQPIVENSLIYSEEESEINIHVYTKKVDLPNEGEKEILIIIEDNGPGISPEVIERIQNGEKNINKFSKVGLNNVNQRIKMYFGEEYGLLIEDIDGEGTRIIIRIPRKVANEI
jgi:two-component system sensor histidine kinase YesM